MDTDVAVWILDFLLRQPSIPDGLLNSLTSSLPLPFNNLNLSRAILLRKIEAEIANGTISENILDLLELACANDHKAGVPATVAMKQAYCWLAVECTVSTGGDAEEYFETVKRVWRERVKVMGELGLFSDELAEWREVIEAAVWNPTEMERLMERCIERDALGAVRAYVKEAWEGLGPSFVEVVASDGAALEALGLLERESEGEGDFRAGEMQGEEIVSNGDKVTMTNDAARDVLGLRDGDGTSITPEIRQVEIIGDGDNVMTIDDEMTEVFPSADNQVLGQTPDINNGEMLELREGEEAYTAPEIEREEIVDNGDKDIMTNDTTSEMLRSGDNQVLQQTSILNNVNNVIMPQRGTHQARRKHVAKKRSRKFVAGTSRGAKVTDTEQVNQDLSNRYGSLPSPAIVKIRDALRKSAIELKAVVNDPLPEALELAENFISGKNVDNSDPEVQENNGDLERPCTSHQNNAPNAPKHSLMTRQSAAQTYEWDDSIDNLCGGDGESRSKCNLPSPKNRDISPLKKYEMKNLRGRRNKKWTPLEEETLSNGVDKYGKGNWKTILKVYLDVFYERTEVDLKDKWRNMTKNSY